MCVTTPTVLAIMYLNNFDLTGGANTYHLVIWPECVWGGGGGGEEGEGGCVFSSAKQIS